MEAYLLLYSACCVLILNWNIHYIDAKPILDELKFTEKQTICLHVNYACNSVSVRTNELCLKNVNSKQKSFSRHKTQQVRGKSQNKLLFISPNKLEMLQYLHILSPLSLFEENIKFSDSAHESQYTIYIAYIHVILDVTSNLGPWTLKVKWFPTVTLPCS